MTIALNGLLIDARRIIKSGIRSSDEITLLETALRRFVIGPANAVNTNGADHLAKFSLRITDAGLSKRTTNYLEIRGVLLVGEAYFLYYGNGHKHHRPDVLAELEEKLGIPQNTRPVKEGWSPPYWDDPVFMNALNMTPKLYGREYKKPISTKSETMSEFLIANRGNPKEPDVDGRTWFKPGRLESLKKRLQKDSILHAAAVLPP
ncbi:MAG: hypothetical protein WC802_04275 [Patescibacteria group bacterium]|jgi:hypothetical protein